MNRQVRIEGCSLLPSPILPNNFVARAHDEGSGLPGQGSNALPARGDLQCGTGSPVEPKLPPWQSLVRMGTQLLASLSSELLHHLFECWTRQCRESGPLICNCLVPRATNRSVLQGHNYFHPDTLSILSSCGSSQESY